MKGFYPIKESYIFLCTANHAELGKIKWKLWGLLSTEAEYFNN